MIILLIIIVNIMIMIMIILILTIAIVTHTQVTQVKQVTHSNISGTRPRAPGARHLAVAARGDLGGGANGVAATGVTAFVCVFDRGFSLW